MQLLFNMMHVPDEVLSKLETLERDMDDTSLLRFLCHVGHARAVEEVYFILLGSLRLNFFSPSVPLLCAVS